MNITYCCPSVKTVQLHSTVKMRFFFTDCNLSAILYTTCKKIFTLCQSEVGLFCVTKPCIFIFVKCGKTEGRSQCLLTHIGYKIDTWFCVEKIVTSLISFFEVTRF